MTTLDLAQLTALAAAVEEGSFDAAARRLHVTPSAVSQRIKALESQTGRILVRRSRPTRPTDAGQVLVRLARQLTLLESEAFARLSDDAADPEGLRLRLPVAVNADSVATWFLDALATVPQRHVATFDIRQEDQDHSIALLRDGSVMAAVTTEPRAVQGCRVERLGAMRYRAVVSPEFHSRYFADGPTADALHAAPMLVYNRKDALQSRFAELLTGVRPDPPVTYLPSSTGFVDAARLGLGWGMVPEQLAAPGIDAADLVELAPGRTMDVPLYWQRWRLESSSLAALTDAVKRQAQASLR
ncbi:MAG: LysR family transcriptional regulator ArgP [Actinomycetota bacterium]